MAELIELHPVKGEARVDSRIIARGLENQHEAVIKLVEDYRSDFEEFGVVRFQIGKPPSSKGADREGDMNCLTIPKNRLSLSSPLQKTAAGRRNPSFQTARSANPADSGAFFMPEIPLWRAGRGTRKRGRFPFEPVFDPRSVRLPFRVETERDGFIPYQTEPNHAL
jgi:hypothetical protein